MQKLSYMFAVSRSRYLYGLDFGQVRAQNYFFDFWAWEGILIPPSCVRSQSHGGKLEFLAKIATRNRKKRQLSEYCPAH